MERETNKIVKKKNVKKHKSSKRKKDHDSSGEESIDLSEKIFPIAHFINDREEMIKQVFSVMEKEKLNCMLPPILKGMAIGVLKEKCLKELSKMSNDEVQRVLCGETIEGSMKKPPSKIDSDSCQSLPSVEECNNTEKEKRTLLDILEQEMQEIAYNTVLKRVEKPESESDDELPEIVAITPTNSPSWREANNVELICIDSGDDEPDKCAPDIGNNMSQQLDNCNDACKGDADMPQILTSNKNIEIVDVNKNPASFVDLSATSPSGSTSETNGCNLEQLPKTNHSQESFMVQVFSSNTSSERVVKKVFKSCSTRPDLIKNPIVNTEEVKAASEAKNDELSDGGKNDLTSMNNLSIVEVHNPNPTSEIDEIEIIKENISSQQSSTLESQVCENTISMLVDSCIPLQDSIDPNDLAHDEVSCESKAEEKEEGEITEEESEEDVEILQNQDDHQTSTIFLSSDDSDVKSSHGRQEHKNKTRKHHHKSKGNKKSTVSPERSRRRIEKRGNRSYRRKTTSIVTENQSHKEKKKEATPESLPSSNNAPLSDDKTLKSHSPETVPASPDKVVPLQVAEEMETEICDHPTSPNTLEIHISDTKLDSSEETEKNDSLEPVSTKTSWADRWAEKKDLKKVVITSKICQNVRKRILSARRKQTNPEPSTSTQIAPLPPVPPLVLHVEGSVQEYQMLQLLDNEERCELNPPILESLPLPSGNDVDVSSADPNHHSKLPEPCAEEHNRVNKTE